MKFTSLILQASMSATSKRDLNMSQPTSLQTKLAGQIMAAIRSGELIPGMHLKEVELADRFGVSRSPIRGALAYLASQEMIERLSQGYRVRQDGVRPVEIPPSEDEQLYQQLIKDRLDGVWPEQVMEADLLRRYDVGKSVLQRCLLRLAEEGVMQRRRGHGWVFQPTLLSPRTRYESYRYRMLLEPTGLLEPTFQLDLVRLQRCRERQQALLDQGPSSAIDFFEANAEFHEMLAAASGNAFILQAITQQNRLRRFIELRTVSNPERVRISCREHLEILSALEAGDRNWAATLLGRHLEVAGGRPRDTSGTQG